MSKLFIFPLLWWLTGNPLLAIILTVAVIYVIDRRYVGLFPDVTKPFQTAKRLAQLKQSINLNPHNNSEKLEMARILNGKKRYAHAKKVLEGIAAAMEDSAELWFELGSCELALGNLQTGEQHMQRALKINPRVAYGEPYLRMGEAFAKHDTAKALSYLRKFGEVQSSSCEAYYLLGQLYRRIGQQDEAAEAFREVLNIYRILPKYKKKSERRWAMLARLKVLGGSR